MQPRQILARRLHNQGLASAPFATAEAAVRTLLAVQSQDLPGARWGVGQRVKGATDVTIQAAYDDGRILRTHVLRPTWHFVTPDDIGWLLELTARALSTDPQLATLRGYVEDSGEGRWTLNDAVERGVPMPALTAALFTRFRSRSDNPFSERLLAALRQQFGGHAVKPAGGGTGQNGR